MAKQTKEKRTTTIYVSRSILDQANELKINVSKTCEGILLERLGEAKGLSSKVKAEEIYNICSKCEENKGWENIICVKDNYGDLKFIPVCRECLNEKEEGDELTFKQRLDQKKMVFLTAKYLIKDNVNDRLKRHLEDG